MFIFALSVLSLLSVSRLKLTKLSILTCKFLHGDIDVFGDIANIATFASAIFSSFLRSLLSLRSSLFTLRSYIPLPIVGDKLFISWLFVVHSRTRTVTSSYPLPIIFGHYVLSLFILIFYPASKHKKSVKFLLHASRRSSCVFQESDNTTEITICTIGYNTLKRVGFTRTYLVTFIGCLPGFKKLRSSWEPQTTFSNVYQHVLTFLRC